MQEIYTKIKFQWVVSMQIRKIILGFIACLTTLHGVEEGKISADFIKDFERYAEQAQAAWHVPGMAIGIVQGHKTVLSKGYGMKELRGDEPIGEETLFEIGSLTKAFTSVLAALLVDESKLEWEDSVIDYLPEFVLYDPWVTRSFQIQDLFSMRSGLNPHAGDEQAYFGAGRLEMINHLRYIPPVTSFRSAFAYQNSFFLVAGETFQALTGSSWEELIKKRLFDPLKMKNSNTSFKSFLAGKNISLPHKRREGKTKALPANYPFKDAYTIFGPAGGINTISRN